MSDSITFRSVSKRHPCKVCNHVDGCMVANEGQTVAVICSRTESRQRCGRAAFLHILKDDGPVWSASRQRVLKAAKRIAEASEK